MAAEVAPIQAIKLPAGPTDLTSDQKYWRTFTSQLLLPSPQSSPITSISGPSGLLLPSANHVTSATAESFAVTAGTRIQIFSSRTRKVQKTITRFNIDDVARGGHIRRDGRILIAGGDSGAIQAFDINSRAILKTWREHKQPVWVTRWNPNELTGAMSASDDKTVRLWDLPSESSTTTFVGHTDYVRCGDWMPDQAAGMVVSGSYDSTVRLWDARVGNKAVMVFKHSAAVEAVLPMPGGTTLLAAAGEQVSVLDLVAARPVQVLRNHQKTVTALSLAGKGSRVLTGALDGHVKVFDTQKWEVVAGFKYPSPVLSLSVVPAGAEKEDRHLVVGMQSGLLSIRTRLSGQQKAVAKEKQKEMKALVEGRIEEYDRKNGKRKRGKGWEKRLRGRDFTGEGADIIVDGEAWGRKYKSTKWESALRKGKYEQALDIVLAETKIYPPSHTFTLLTTLIHRSALRTALSNRDEVTLQPVLSWLLRHVSNPRYIQLVSDVAMQLLDIYGEHMGQSPEIDNLVDRLHNAVRKNAEVAQLAWATQGMLEMLGTETAV